MVSKNLFGAGAAVISVIAFGLVVKLIGWCVTQRNTEERGSDGAEGVDQGMPGTNYHWALALVGNCWYYCTWKLPIELVARIFCTLLAGKHIRHFMLTTHDWKYC